MDKMNIMKQVKQLMKPLMRSMTKPVMLIMVIPGTVNLQKKSLMPLSIFLNTSLIHMIGIS